MPFHLSAPLPVAVLGATSPLGQHLVARLAAHPWFKLVAVAENRSMQDRDAARRWYPPISGVPVSLASLPLLPCDPAAFPGVKIVFSALSTPDARKVEAACAEAGMAVLSTADYEHLSPDVPMLLPEVNPDHAAAIPLQRKQRGWLGCLVTNPSSLATSLALTLKPLQDAFDLEQVVVTTLPDSSRNVRTSLSDPDGLDTTAPFLPGAEEHIERETRRLLGSFDGELGFLPSPVRISIRRNREARSDEQVLWVKGKLACHATCEDLLVAWDLGSPQRKHLGLPSAPSRTLLYRPAGAPCHPRLDDSASQIAIHISHLRADSRMDFAFVTAGPGTMSSVAGRSLLQAEYLLGKGYLDDLDWPNARQRRTRTTCRQLRGGRCA